MSAPSNYSPVTARQLIKVFKNYLYKAEKGYLLQVKYFGGSSYLKNSALKVYKCFSLFLENEKRVNLQTEEKIQAN